MMECPGITFTVQWKKKSGTVSRQDDTSIGLWDPDDSTLDWRTFKSYLCQNLGTLGNISVSYIDSEGDELPIENECEFQEALKFARHRARVGKETVLKVDRQESGGFQTVVNKIAEKVIQDKEESSLMACIKPKSRISLKSSHASNEYTKTNYLSNVSEERTCKEGGSGASVDFSNLSDVDSTECLVEILEKLKKLNLEEMDTPPPWFKRYMQKMKNDIVAEVTSNILHEIQRIFPVQREHCESVCTGVWPLKKNKKKKKHSDEESSDGARDGESRDHKILKKIEKLHKREKKLEKKLDSKLEKLENKTKRMMEKRSQSKARSEKIPERKSSSRKRKTGDYHVNTYLMDAILLNDGTANEITIHPGQYFTKVWEIMNAGSLPWTDKTELRQAWGTSGLEPEETVMKCPILQPGEQGTISMKFRAPEFPGKFKSYWHFYHMGDRFGHWIVCSVVVKDRKDKQPENCKVNEQHVLKSAETNDLSLDSNFKNKSVELNKLCKSEYEQSINSSTSSKREDYESDFESDILSVISGPGSVSSDSDDENFVVIPMPSCFVYDVPLEETKTVPVVVKLNPKEDYKILNNLNNEEVTESDPPLECNNHEGYLQLLSPVAELFAVDSSGICFPVKKVTEPVHQQTEVVNGATTTDRDKSSGADQGTDGNHQQNFHGSSGIPSSSNNCPAGHLGHDTLTNVIHILPETLVTGAVNVASSAYSTARAVISNLRTRQQGDGPKWQFSPGGIKEQPVDRTTSENVDRLLEMGFTNRILNVLLLQRYDNDILKVVAELISMEDDEM